jgi:hypothetical protein
LLLHTKPAPKQVSLPTPIQQGRPSDPHAIHRPAEQRVAGAVHVLVPSDPVQQGKPAPPQVPHAPALQTPPRAPQMAPGLAHTPEMQQPLLLQVFPGQQP